MDDGKGSRSWDRVFSFPVAIAGMLAAQAFWICRDRIADPDFWWHLRNGQQIAAHWALPTVDSYSFTAAGSPWLDHSWLSEVVFYGAHHALGLSGVFAIFALAVAATSLGIFALCRMQTEDPVAAGIAAVYGGLLAMVGFSPRAQNFGWLCFVAVFAILMRFRNARRAPLWLLPFLFCLWINCHGGWPVGFAVAAIFLFCGWVGRGLGPLAATNWTPAERRKLALALLASVAAVFLNPLGYRLVRYPFDLMFHQPLNVALVIEWAPVNFNDARGMVLMAGLGALFLMALLSRRRWPLEDVVLTLFVLLCGLKHMRLLMLAGIVLPAIMAPHFGKISSYDAQHQRRRLNALVACLALASVVFSYPSAQALQSDVDQAFPASAVRYLYDHPQSGNMLNNYDWGGYLEWSLPQVPTFIDSRVDIFEYRGVLKDYFAITTLQRTEELLNRYRISFILYSVNTPLEYFLSKSTTWECIYKDNQAVIYRRVQAQGPQGARLAADR